MPMISTAESTCRSGEVTIPPNGFAPLTTYDLDAFLEEYGKNVEKGVFRRRTAEELAEAVRHHFTLRINGMLQGGVSLIPRGDQWVDFCVWWARENSNGVGRKIIAHAMDEARGKFLFALSTNPKATRIMSGSGFELIGPVSLVQRCAMAKFLPEQILEYDADKRDPYVLIHWKPRHTA